MKPGKFVKESIPRYKFKKGHTPWNKGIKLSKKHKIKISNSLKGTFGEKNPNWKGGIKKTMEGYILVYKPNHPFCNKSYIREHRLIMEKHLGRYLKSQEIVHHIDDNPSNNCLKNFILFKNCGYHCVFHRWKHCNPKGILFDGRKLKLT